MVKNKLAVAAVFTIAFSLSTIYVNAQVKILKQYTNYTYAKYDHIDNSLDDEYRSDVSIRGADRITTLHRPAQSIHRTTETSER